MDMHVSGIRLLLLSVTPNGVPMVTVINVQRATYSEPFQEFVQHCP